MKIGELGKTIRELRAANIQLTFVHDIINAPVRGCVTPCLRTAAILVHAYDTDSCAFRVTIGWTLLRLQSAEAEDGIHVNSIKGNGCNRKVAKAIALGRALAIRHGREPNPPKWTRFGLCIKQGKITNDILIEEGATFGPANPLPKRWLEECLRLAKRCPAVIWA